MKNPRKTPDRGAQESYILEQNLKAERPRTEHPDYVFFLYVKMVGYFVSRTEPYNPRALNPKPEPWSPKP